MADFNQQEKTEEPTRQRREDFRKKGHVAQTRELASFFILLTGFIGLGLVGRLFLVEFSSLFETSFFLSHKESLWNTATIHLLKEMIFILIPVFLIFLVVSFFASVFQVGFLYNEEALQFKLDRLNPISGFRRILSLKSFVEGLKTLLKFLLISGVIVIIFQGEMKRIPYLVFSNVGQSFLYLGIVGFKVFGGASLVLALLSGLDYLFQRWDVEKKMKMTKQEVKEELKSREGDPLVKARIRRIQKEMLNQKMIKEVPKADVVVTNPTHIAVAIKYTKELIAPQVIAKGAGVLAERIKKIAKENKVPVMENKPLAQVMYKTLKIGELIPRALYSVVAEILSRVYKLKNKAFI